MVSKGPDEVVKNEIESLKEAIYEDAKEVVFCKSQNASCAGESNLHKDTDGTDGWTFKNGETITTPKIPVYNR